MTPQEAREILSKINISVGMGESFNLSENQILEATSMAIEALEQQTIDKLAMMYEIYMNGVNMSGEYQGCWVRFKDIEKIVDKYIEGSESK